MRNKKRVMTKILHSIVILELESGWHTGDFGVLGACLNIGSGRGGLQLLIRKTLVSS